MRFMPHGHCYLWQWDVLLMHVVSDVLIALAYYSIPVTLFVFVRRRPDVPFPGVFYLFGAFITLCGTTHVLDVWTTWSAAYRIEGAVKLVTAAVSVATAFALIPILPKAIAFPSLQATVEALTHRTGELTAANTNLERFNRAAVQREERMVELKREVNLLSQALGRPGPYGTPTVGGPG